jgi:hypothetical protein
MVNVAFQVACSISIITIHIIFNICHKLKDKNTGLGLAKYEETNSCLLFCHQKEYVKNM